MNAITLEIIIIVLLLAANGVFAMTEIAVVSARKPRLQRLAATGVAPAKAALQLAESPNRFLATVQVGITLVGVLVGAFGVATIAGEIAGALQAFPGLAAYGEIIGIGVVVFGITFCSLILGELVPKRIGLIDVMVAIVGELPSPAERLKPEARKRADGSWLIDGSMPVEKLPSLLSSLRFQPAERRDFATLGEFVALRLGPTFKEAETFDEQGFRFEALDKDGARVDKMLITPLDSGSPLLKPGSHNNLSANP